MIAWVLGLAVAGKAITDANHADWRWRTLTTDHFRIHYPTSGDERLGAELAAARIAGEADAIWLRMGDALDWFPSEVITVVVIDDGDGLDAWAWPLRGTIVISARPAAELGRIRSRGDQLVDVFAHELAHVFTHKSACAFSERASYGADAWGLGEVRGVAVAGRLPAAATLPQWWTEGGAEFLSASVGHGWWSPGRMAGVRQALLDDRLLTWDELQVATDKDDVGDAELAYQQGHAFLRWLEQREGPGTYARLSEIARRHSRLDPAAALERLTGRSARALYAEHVADLRAELAAEPAPIGPIGRELWPWDQDWSSPDLSDRDAWAGRRRRDRERTRESTGSANLYPRWSPDGRWLGEHRAGWVRVRRSHEGDWPALADQPVTIGANRARAAEGRDQELWIPAAYGSGFAFVPGRDALVVTGPTPMVGPSVDGDDYTRLYLVDLTPTRRGGRQILAHPGRRATPIPGTDRGFDPAVSSDGSRLAFGRFRAGRSELVVARLDGSEPIVVATMDPGSWVGQPSWSPDGRWLACGVFHASRSDLWAFAADGSEVRRLTDDRWEEADPTWAVDGVYFVADVDGTFDVFRLDDDGAIDRITRVPGGAATPSLTPSGHLLYAHRTGHGWKSMALRRDGFAWEPSTDRFVVHPEAPPPVVPPLEPVSSRRYGVLRSGLPLAAAPELQVAVDPVAGAAALAGGSFGARDAAELLELWGRALVGVDLLLSGSVTARVLPMDLGVWAQRELDQRIVADGSRARVDADTVGVAADWPIVPDGLAVGGELRVRWLGWGGPTGADLARTTLGTLGLRLGSTAWQGEIGATGGSLVVGAARATSVDPLGGAIAWWRGTADASGATHWGPVTVDARAFAGATDRSVPAFDALRAGGDAPSALRLAWWEPSVALPGFAPRSLAGEQLALVGAGVVVPIPDLRRWLGGVYLDDLGVRLGADAARAWGPTRSDAPVVGDVVAEVRLAATAADQTWNSAVRLARGFGAPLPTGDPTDPPWGPTPWRLVVGVGTGW